MRQPFLGSVLLQRGGGDVVWETLLHSSVCRLHLESTRREGEAQAQEVVQLKEAVAVLEAQCLDATQALETANAKVGGQRRSRVGGLYGRGRLTWCSRLDCCFQGTNSGSVRQQLRASALLFTVQPYTSSPLWECDTLATSLTLWLLLVVPAAPVC